MVVAVLCGGAGTRLWPASRPDRPKPLLPLGSRTPLRATLDRFAPLGPALGVVGPAHADAIAREAPELRLLIEPEPRGTGPAIALAAASVPRDELVLVTPSDHAVADAPALLAAVRSASPAAASGRIVTFGVAPTFPATGFGWIAPGAELGGGIRAIDRFVEKPDPERAVGLMQSGCLWNAGLFLFRAGTLLDEIERLGVADRAGAFDVLVMERTDRGAVIAVDCGWSDLGTWDAAPDRGPVRAVDSPGSSGWSDGPAVLVLGVPGVRVVASAGGVLVYRPGLADRVGALAPELPSRLDGGPGWSVERVSLAAGETLRLGDHDRATIVAGPGRGESVAGTFVATAPTVLVVVRVA